MEKKRRSTKYARLGNHLLYEMCRRLVEEGQGATKIADWLKAQKCDFTREEVYRLIREGIARGYVMMCPPREERLAQRVADRFGAFHSGAQSFTVDNIRVVDVDEGPHGEKRANMFHEVASAAADLAFDLVEGLARQKGVVHLGLGSGRTTMEVAQRLSFRLRSLERPIPKLVCHALSGGFSGNWLPLEPVSFFSCFRQSASNVEYYGLFVPAVVPPKEYKMIRELPGVQQAFAAAKEIDIVITSLASAEDTHSGLRHFMPVPAKPGEKGDGWTPKGEGWVGDVQFKPYTETKPVDAKRGYKAMTLFELSELVDLARQKDKYVILVAGPCGGCGRLKTDAVRPLLREPSLKVWTHLVTDVATARALVETAPAPVPPVE